MSDERHFIKAYRVAPDTGWIIEPASGRRDWMERTNRKGAYLCLPLTMACSAGWIVRLPESVSIRWNGKDSPDSISFDFGRGDNVLKRAMWKNFGAGIVSFALPWIFKTSPGTGLWVRGVPNEYTPDCVPLEGMVETDWSPFSFTMNYRIVKRNTTVYFKKGQPLCLLAPVRFDLFESFDASMHAIDDDPEFKAEFDAFVERRGKSLGVFEAEPDLIDSEGRVKPSLDYMKGQTTSGENISRWHRKAFEIRGFEEMGGRDPQDPLPSQPPRTRDQDRPGECPFK